jgi:hypothetical protein
MINEKARERLAGLMVDNTLVSGKQANNMVKELI